MNHSSPSLVPLQPASLCLDCELITPAHKTCLAWGSGALLNIARALSGTGYLAIARFDNAAIADVTRKRCPPGANFIHST